MHQQILLSLPIEELKSIISEAISECLTRKSSPEQSPIEVINRTVLCERLGISEQTVINHEKKGKIPCFRIGSNVRYNWPAVVQQLEEKRKGGVRC